MSHLFTGINVCFICVPQQQWHPIAGLNAGVMLMNLTRMRQVDWMRDIAALYKEHHKRLSLGDQDLINVYFHYYPSKSFSSYIFTQWLVLWNLQGGKMLLFFAVWFAGRVVVLPCEWNARSDHCAYGPYCKSADANGASLIHGHRRVFHSGLVPIFQEFYSAFRDVSVFFY